MYRTHVCFLWSRHKPGLSSCFTQNIASIITISWSSKFKKQ